MATIAADGTVLDTWFPAPELAGDGPSGTVRLSVAEVPAELAELAGRDEDRDVDIVVVRTVIASLDDKPADTYDAYLRLHLLSHRLIPPHGASVDGIFGVLANVVWTNYGPCAVEGFETVRARLRRRGPVTVYGIDKFPRMVDYVAPTGVRIADADRVRLGAHLAAGTTVMHEGFVNFNAGTLGTSMVEGRISAGVIVDDGSDVGGGASIMGTLSGGGTEVISVGKRCLLGANSGLGISLGDDCVVEAGPVRHGRHEGADLPTVRRSRPASSRARTTFCSAAIRSAVRSRWSPATARASRSTRRCTPTESAQHSTTLSARPPRAVSLYLSFMSAPVSRMVLTALSSDT